MEGAENCACKADSSQKDAKEEELILTQISKMKQTCATYSNTRKKKCIANNGCVWNQLPSSSDGKVCSYSAAAMELIMPAPTPPPTPGKNEIVNNLKCTAGQPNSVCTVAKGVCPDETYKYRALEGTKGSLNGYSYEYQSQIPCGRYESQTCMTTVEFKLPTDVAALLASGGAAGDVRLLTYFVNEANGEMVPDEVVLDVARSLQTKLSLTVAPPGSGVDYYRPGDDVIVSLQVGARGGAGFDYSLCDGFVRPSGGVADGKGMSMDTEACEVFGDKVCGFTKEHGCVGCNMLDEADCETNVFGETRENCAWSKAETLCKHTHSGDATSLVGLAAIDKSVLLLRDQAAFTAAGVLAEQAEATAIVRDKYNLHAATLISNAGLVMLTSPGIHAPKKPINNWWRGGWGDGDMIMPEVAFDAPPMQAPSAAPPPPPQTSKTSDDSASAEPTRTRAYFPETWLYDARTIADGEAATITLSAPDTITSWMLSGVAVSSATGLGISTATTLKVFQPFFLEMKLPYSVVRGESFELVVAVYNYEGDDTKPGANVTVTLGSLSESDTAPLALQQYKTLGTSVKQCVGVSASRPCSVSFFVEPLKVGSIQLAVNAQSATQADAAVRKLRVKPEGVEKGYTTSKFIEMSNGKATALLTTAVPTDSGVVPGSVSVQFTATTDLMGQSIEGLESLVRLPTGCGEQNMYGDRYAGQCVLLEAAVGTYECWLEVSVRVVCCRPISCGLPTCRPSSVVRRLPSAHL
jgi:CD109 antigen